MSHTSKNHNERLGNFDGIVQTVDHQKISLYHIKYDNVIDNNNKISIFGSFGAVFQISNSKDIDSIQHIRVGICVWVIMLENKLYSVRI